ncbi:SDR family NAD(P)-dependent oxidoreductase [Arthrobacter crystallopoietes]|uniref:SDR family NAD(P)-dependent oxidoreductase n=1 Tax=Crystallibacter crystallopoietes TaxID=37928 RepID=UPI0011112E6B|nr:SDR family oxidoreductase [Arthrobacter crystallopoietes]
MSELGPVLAITGAASGIGASTVQLALNSGYRVVALDKKTPEFTERDELLQVSCDITDVTALEQILVRVEERWPDGLEALIHCAGIYRTSASEDADLALWQEVQHVNVTGSYLVASVLGRPMLRQGRGSIVFLSSIAYSLGDGREPGAAYAASKGAVVSLGRQLAAEWGPRGVRTNVVAPGVIDTPMTTIVNNVEGLGKVLENIPLQRLGEAEEVAQACLYLASRNASYVNGVVLPVDGGQTIV